MARTVVFAEQTLSGFVYDNAFGCYAVTAPTLLFTLTEGQEYVAVFDGEEYTLTAVAFTNGTSECVYIGNTLTQGGANNGIPFAVVCDITYGYTHVMSLDTAASHTVALYADESEPEPEPEPDPTTPYVQLYDRAGAPGNYEIGKGIRLFSADGTPRDFIFSNPVETTVQPDFSEGDIEVLPGDAELFSKVIIQKPETLVPENIAAGIDIAGIIGAFAASGSSAKMASGKIPTAGGPITVEHGLGVFPDVVVVWVNGAMKSSIVYALGINKTLADKLGVNVCCMVWARNSSNADTCMQAGWGLGATTGPYIHNVTEATFDIGNSTYPLSTTLFRPNWLAIGGLI